MTLIQNEPKKIYIWNTEVKSVRLWETKVRPTYKPRTFTITRTEKSDMSSWWTYSDDAAWLTAGDGAFDDFFWYSAVLLNTSGVETAEMKQSWWVFTWAMSTLGNITSGDNVMIKFPVRWIKMSKSWSTVTLSITEELDKDGYQYYAHSTGTLSNPWTPKNAFYLWAYEWYAAYTTLKSWSWWTPTANQTSATLCTYAGNNGSGYNIIWWYQRMYVNALYMMKYWNPDSRSVVWQWFVYTWYISPTATWWTNSQTNATYWTSSQTQQIKLFWLEDRWGNILESLWWAYLDSSNYLYVQLSWYSGTLSWWENTWSILQSSSSGYNLSSIVWNNKAMFWPSSTVNNSNYNTYYCTLWYAGASCLINAGGYWNSKSVAGVLNTEASWWPSVASSNLGSRLQYL